MNVIHEKKELNIPLSRSITTGCIVFIVLLCIVIGVVSHLNYSRALYRRYEAYIRDILTYVDSHIDDDDLVRCIETLERSPKFDELELFMDDIKEDFDIHYLYILKPLNTTGMHSMMSVISAENYYDRYIDTEGNLYLGWISEDEYDAVTMKKLFEIMETKEIVFFEETTDWGTDYTGALALRDSSGLPYAILAVDVDISDIVSLIMKRTLENTVIIVVLGILFTGTFLFWAAQNISNPIRVLEESVVEYANKSHGQRSVEALKYDAPEIHTHNEVAALGKAVTQMTEDMQDYVTDIISAEKRAFELKQKADQLNALANRDALTGIRNKTAYDNEVVKMEVELNEGTRPAFGIGMIDLNFLKKVNDTYGHDKGNIAIKKLCFLVCTTFRHSPVFRIGGDEFVVILQGQDLENVNDLIAQFNSKLASCAEDDNLEPWEKVSAAIGVAFYDKDKDDGVQSVFKRADEEMYACKKAMKAMREE